MPEGGTLTVAVDEAVPSDAGGLAPGRYVRLAVADTGTGMDADTLERAVEPYFSSKGLGKGTGLGLSMVHGLAVQSSGALRLSSQPEVGTRAELWLPAAAALAETPEAAPSGSPEKEAGRLAVLVVDDDFLVAMGTVAMLEDLGHSVVEAHSGSRALEVLRSGQEVDLLVTDQAMPGMTGVQLAQAARALRPGLPVLLATGYADLPDGVGEDLPRLSKPYQQRQLADQIAALVGRPSAASRHPA
jgi:CheY-like chemotaxis protein